MKSRQFYWSNSLWKSDLLEYVLQQFNFHKTNSLQQAHFYIPSSFTKINQELSELPNTIECIFFSIDQSDYITCKKSLWLILEKAFNRDYVKKLMPETFVLKNKHHRKLFLEQYSPDELYILKNNKQAKKGLLLTNNKQFIFSKKAIDQYKIVQKYVQNLFLVNNRKINLRIYWLFLYYEKSIFPFLYHEGKCIYTNKKYDPDTFDPQSHFTSLELNKSIYNHLLLVTDLSNILSNTQYNQLFSNIIQNSKIISNFIKHKIIEKNPFPNVVQYQLFGVDYLFDKDMNVYLLEINKGPSLRYVNKQDKQLKYYLLYDMMSHIWKEFHPNFIKLY